MKSWTENLSWRYPPQWLDCLQSQIEATGGDNVCGVLMAKEKEEVWHQQWQMESDEVAQGWKKWRWIVVWIPRGCVAHQSRRFAVFFFSLAHPTQILSANFSK